MESKGIKATGEREPNFLGNHPSALNSLRILILSIRQLINSCPIVEFKSAS